jgi:hypothetical protein
MQLLAITARLAPIVLLKTMLLLETILTYNQMLRFYKAVQLETMLLSLQALSLALKVLAMLEIKTVVGMLLLIWVM